MDAIAAYVSGDAVPPLHLGLAGGRYLTCEPILPDYIDGKSTKAERLKSLPEPPFETVVYDLHELFRRNVSYRLSPEGGNAGQQAPTGGTGGLDQP